MHQRLNQLRGGPVRAVDGDVGTIRDFYFDHDTWTIRYVVVDTGKWLRGRLVLIPLWALETPEWSQARVPVRLTREQVRRSPDIDTHQPVSRKAEQSALAHFDYPLYWGGPALWGPVPAPALLATLPPPRLRPEQAEADAETHLRSCAEVAGYHIHARDGEIGHIDDFVVNESSWAIEHLLLDTSNWIGGRAVLIEPRSIERISWADKRVYVALTREAVERSPSAEA